MPSDRHAAMMTVDVKNVHSKDRGNKKSKEDKISMKAVLEVSPSYLIKGKNKNMTSKIRVVADACFR